MDNIEIKELFNIQTQLAEYLDLIRKINITNPQESKTLLSLENFLSNLQKQTSSKLLDKIKEN
jgi:hypothetical protein